MARNQGVSSSPKPHSPSRKRGHHHQYKKQRSIHKKQPVLTAVETPVSPTQSTPSTIPCEFELASPVDEAGENNNDEFPSSVPPTITSSEQHCCSSISEEGDSALSAAAADSIILPGGGGEEGSEDEGLEQEQKRRVIDPARYKTKLCRSYVLGIPCAFGDRCAFSHGDQDTVLLQTQLEHAHQLQQHHAHVAAALSPISSSQFFPLGTDVSLSPTSDADNTNIMSPHYHHHHHTFTTTYASNSNNYNYSSSNKMNTTPMVTPPPVIVEMRKASARRVLIPRPPTPIGEDRMEFEPEEEEKKKEPEAEHFEQDVQQDEKKEMEEEEDEQVKKEHELNVNALEFDPTSFVIEGHLDGIFAADGENSDDDHDDKDDDKKGLDCESQHSSSFHHHQHHHQCLVSLSMYDEDEQHQQQHHHKAQENGGGTTDDGEEEEEEEGRVYWNENSRFRYDPYSLADIFVRVESIDVN